MRRVLLKSDAIERGHRTVDASQYQSRVPLRLAVLEPDVSLDARLGSRTPPLVSYVGLGPATPLSCLQCEARSSSHTHALFQSGSLEVARFVARLAGRAVWAGWRGEWKTLWRQVGEGWKGGRVIVAGSRCRGREGLGMVEPDRVGVNAE